MPRYNLNHQDVQTLVSGLAHLALNAHSTKEHTRITNLRDRLLNKINEENSSQNQIANLRDKLLNKVNEENSSQNQSSDNDSDIDVWDAFR